MLCEQCQPEAADEALGRDTNGVAYCGPCLEEEIRFAIAHDLLTDHAASLAADGVATPLEAWAVTWARLNGQGADAAVAFGWADAVASIFDDGFADHLLQAALPGST